MGLENKTSTWYIWMKFAAKINALKVVCNYFILVTQTEENPFFNPFQTRGIWDFHASSHLLLTVCLSFFFFFSVIFAVFLDLLF